MSGAIRSRWCRQQSRQEIMRFGSSLAACDQDHGPAQGPSRRGVGSAQMRQHRMFGLGVRMAGCWCLLEQRRVATRGVCFVAFPERA